MKFVGLLSMTPQHNAAGLSRIMMTSFGLKKYIMGQKNYTVAFELYSYNFPRYILSNFQEQK